MAKATEGANRGSRKLRSRELKGARHSGRVYVAADGRTAPAQEIEWDSEVRGLGLRKHATGRAAWVLRYYVGRRRRLVKLGDAGVLNLKQARDLARLRLAELTSTGRDPFGQRKGVCVRDLVPLFLEDAARRLKASTVDRYRLDLRAVEAALGRWSVDTLDRRAVASAFLDWTRQRGATAANASLGRVGQLLEFAASQGLRDSEAPNPAHRIGRNRERRRGLALTDEQLAAVGRELTAEETERPEASDSVAAIRLLALTGCRRREITGLVWAEVDFQNRCLRLRDSKTGPKTVPLSTAALEVFASQGPGAPDSRVFSAAEREVGWAIQYAWNRIRARAGVPAARLHDLRHSHVTRGLGSGLSETLVAKIVGHRSVASTRRYEHVAGTADPVREAAERIGSEVAAALAGRPLATVEELKRG
jgi:integrase